MELTEKDITKYRTNLETAVLAHLNAQSGEWTLTKAHDYVERMVSTIFGTPDHGGIVQYLQQEQTHLNLSLTDAISRAETMIEKGWSVKLENNRWYLLDSNFRKVIDVTGSADIAPAPVVSEIGPDTAWMLLDEKSAKDLAKAAVSQGVEPQMLASPEFSYTFVMTKLGVDTPLFPFVQMYKGMGDILRKLHYFPSKDLTSLDELRAKGFRIKAKLNPSDTPKSYLSSGNKGYTILPVTDIYLEDQPADAVFVPEAYWKADILKSAGVLVETPIQIGEYDHTFALGFEDTGHYALAQDMGEVSRILYTTQEQGRLRNYPIFEKLAAQVAAVFFMETFVVGNSNFTLSNISIDTVKPEVLLRYTGQGHVSTPKEIQFALQNARSDGKLSFADFITLSPGLKDPELVDNLKMVLDILPAGFKSALKNATSEDSYIKKNLETVGEYL